MQVFIDNKSYRLDPSNSIGKGGEADIFGIGNGVAVKIFKAPSHPDYTGQPAEQDAAKQRIETHQKKLPAFPTNLPAHVITPKSMAKDKNGKILGYAMPLVSSAEVLLRYTDRTFRAGFTNEEMVRTFLDMHSTVVGIHKAGAVIGDFNDLNVLVKGQEAFIIDADSFQFKNFYCQVYTTKFVDPLLCDAKATSPVLVKPHTADSDWYAFAVMLMQCLVFVGPYGGVYRPKDSAKRITHEARPLHRITVFNPEVRYPKPAIPYGVLPDTLLDLFHRIFEKDARAEFPRQILENMRWTKCLTCGTEHARSKCPECATAAPAAIKEVVTIRGKVTATRIFRTDGTILYSTIQDGGLRWAYFDGSNVKREDGSVVLAQHKPKLPYERYRISGRATLVGNGTEVRTLSAATETKLSVGTYSNIPMFDSTASHTYWADGGGQLMKDGPLGAERIGDVLAGQTVFWIGPKFGLGFYRAGGFSVAFIFDAEIRGINDSVKLEPIRGQLVDATCAFSGDLAWLIVQTSEKGRRINRCTVIKADGTVLATSESEHGDGSWLGALRGKAAAGNFLLAATDDGIVRVEAVNGTLQVTKEFPDTEPFVDASCDLFAAKEGLYVVSRQEIKLLKIS